MATFRGAGFAAVLSFAAACGGQARVAVDPDQAFARIQVGEARIATGSLRARDERRACTDRGAAADDVCAAAESVCAEAGRLDDDDAETRCRRAEGACRDVTSTVGASCGAAEPEGSET